MPGVPEAQRVAVKELLQQPGNIHFHRNYKDKYIKHGGIEYRDFALDDFDPKTYANRILQALPGNPFHNLDISTALSKLSFSIEHLQGTIQEQVRCMRRLQGALVT